MTLKNYLYLFFILLPFLCSAQTDTIYSVLSPGGIGIGMSFGANTIQGQLGEQFSPYNFAGGITAEIMYKRWVANLGFNGNGIKNSKPIVFKNNVFYEKQISFETTFEGLIGYDILKNKNWRLIPFSGIGTCYIDAFTYIVKPVPIKYFPYLSTGIIIDKFIGNLTFKNATKEIGLFHSHPLPSLSWRFKAEFIHPLLNTDYAQFKGDIFQITFGAMLYLHSYSTPFIKKTKK